MKRILIFVAFFWPHIGGSEEKVRELSQRLVQRHHQVDILTCNTENKPAYEELGGVNVYRIPCWKLLDSTYPVPRPSLKGLRILVKLLHQKYDIVITQTRFFPTSFLGLVFARIARIPLLHVEHGTMHSVVTSKATDAVSRLYDHTVGSLLIRLADLNIGISQASCEFLEHLGAGKIQLAYNGIDTATYRKGNSDYRQQLGIPNHAILITFVGRLIYAKGAQDLIAALPKIRETAPHARLLIVGDGPYRSHLQKLARQNGSAGHVIFSGRKSQKEVVRILSATDIYCNPSYSEGLPTTVMEAANLGLPTVATNVGGTKEVIENGLSGLLVSPGQVNELAEAISRLIRDSNLRSRLGEKAGKFMRGNFSWDGTVSRYETLISQVIKGKQNTAINSCRRKTIPDGRKGSTLGSR